MKDLTGRIVGRLTVVSYDKSEGKWLCVCSCGNTKKIYSAELTRQRYTQSCGCYRSEKLARYNVTEKSYKDNLAARLAVYHQYKRSAKRRDKTWELTQEFVIDLIDQPCRYCGTVGSMKMKIRTGHCFHNGIDRLDNGKGYTVDNVVSCCKHCNIAKNTYSEKEFIEWIMKAANHLKVGMSG